MGRGGQLFQSLCQRRREVRIRMTNIVFEANKIKVSSIFQSPAETFFIGFWNVIQRLGSSRNTTLRCS